MVCDWPLGAFMLCRSGEEGWWFNVIGGLCRFEGEAGVPEGFTFTLILPKARRPGFCSRCLKTAGAYADAQLWVNY